MRYLRFQGLDGQVLLDGCGELIGPMSRILPGWSFAAEPAAPGQEPIATIRPGAGGRYRIATSGRPGEERHFDGVDTVCDLIVELSIDLHRSRDWLMCLHAAAIEIGGRLVIVPNVRRAGKSTLTACLAARGHRIFSDDFFPVGLSGEGQLFGHATGILPRLRLPVPASFSHGFRAWVAGNPGDGNRRYKYLALSELPAHGTACPLGAMVFLDRREDAAPALAPMATAEAVAALLHQNFAREVHSGTILSTTEALFRAIPAYRLTYASAEAAADLLAGRLAHWPDPPAAPGAAPAFRRVDENIHAPAAAFDPGAAYIRAPGVQEAELDGDRYLSDESGRGIHRLNAGALAIWHLIAEPMRLSEICEVLVDVFPDAAPGRIAEDSAATLASLVENRLAVPAG